MLGRVVYSKSGRDKGKFMVVVGFSDGMPLIADGKERPIDRPKRKNIKHLKVTNSILEEKQYSTNKSLRRAISGLGFGTAEQEED